MSEPRLIKASERSDVLRFVEATRDMLIGDCVCVKGDVVAVEPPDKRPAAIMPVDPRLYIDRAQQLVDSGAVTPHPGPATVHLGHSLIPPSERTNVETAEDPKHKTAERSVKPPQKGAL